MFVVLLCAGISKTGGRWLRANKDTDIKTNVWACAGTALVTGKIPSVNSLTTHFSMYFCVGFWTNPFDKEFVCTLCLSPPESIFHICLSFVRSPALCCTWGHGFGSAGTNEQQVLVKAFSICGAKQNRTDRQTDKHTVYSKTNNKPHPTNEHQTTNYESWAALGLKTSPWRH